MSNVDGSSITLNMTPAAYLAFEMLGIFWVYIPIEINEKNKMKVAPITLHHSTPNIYIVIIFPRIKASPI